MPLYTNNEKLKIVDMCKVFDEEFYGKERDDNKLFKYLYLIIYSTTLREKPHWFNKFEEFDAYATYSAKVLYMRFIKQQGEGKRVKSILNYFHGAMSGLRINFQKNEFCEVIDQKHNGFNPDQFIAGIQNTMSREYYDSDREEEVMSLLSNIHGIARETIRESPYSRDATMSHRLYISMLLTLLSNLTVNNRAMKRFSKNAGDGGSDMEQVFLRLLEKEKLEKPVLWRLDESMEDYVRLLVNIMKSKLASRLRDIQHYYTIPEDVVMGIMASAYGEGYKNSNTEEE